MKIIIISFTKNGYLLAERLKEIFKSDEVEHIYKGKTAADVLDGGLREGHRVNCAFSDAADEDRDDIGSGTRKSSLARLTADNRGDGARMVKSDVPLDKICRQAFEEKTALLFIGATGIAVRHIAPYIKDKLSDPPVIVMDEKGLHVIPLLSGHVGGANELAYEISEKLGADPVITTATDLNRAFSVDLFAKERNLKIVNRDGIAKVSVKALEGKPITLSIKDYPPKEKVDVVITDDESKYESGTIALRPETGSLSTFTNPSDDKKYALGIGCKKGKNAEAIETAVLNVLKSADINISDVYAVCTIDIKENEEGLLEFTKKYSLPFITFEKELLEKAEGDFTPSEFVKNITGVDNVCERAALLAAGKGSRLVVKKAANSGVTVAVAEKHINNITEKMQLIGSDNGTVLLSAFHKSKAKIILINKSN